MIMMLCAPAVSFKSWPIHGGGGVGSPGTLSPFATLPPPLVAVDREFCVFKVSSLHVYCLISRGFSHNLIFRDEVMSMQ